MYFQFQPDSIDLDIKDSVFVTIKLLDKNGNLSNNPFFVYGGERGTVSAKPRISDSTGVAKVMLKVFKPGDLTLNVRSIAQKRLDRVKDSIPIKVPYPPLEKIIFNKSQISIYEGTSVELINPLLDNGLVGFSNYPEGNNYS